MQKILKTGEGWRLGWSPDALDYQGLVGAEDWAVELSRLEFEDFCRLFLQLAETMAVMAQELMDEERIACELECDRIWLEVEGFPDAYSLRLIVQTGRRCEGNWNEAAVKELLLAVKQIEGV